MGFLLEPGTDRAAVARELAGFAFKELGCSHLEFADRHLSDRSLNESGYSLDVGQSFRSDLRPPEDELFGQMREDARKEIRRALRDGLRAEFTTDPDFAEVHHSFLERVFARQGLAPTYPVERVRQMIAEVLPSGHLKLLVVRSPTDEAVATAISAGRGRMAITVGTAFDRSDRRYHPMSLARWETMRSWKQAGAEEFDFGGGGDYKMKFGPHAVAHHHYFRSRYPWLPAARAGVQRMVRVRQVIRRRR
jgi:hypothetical protein